MLTTKNPGNQTTEYEIASKAGGSMTLLMVLSMLVAGGSAFLDAVDGVDIPSGIIASVSLAVAILSAVLRAMLAGQYVTARTELKAADIGLERQRETLAAIKQENVWNASTSPSASSSQRSPLADAPEASAPNSGK
jgi:hypothetical protein